MKTLLILVLVAVLCGVSWHQLARGAGRVVHWVQEVAR